MSVLLLTKTCFAVRFSAGPYFECAAEWDPWNFDTARCLAGSCGGGKVAKLMAEMKYCVNKGGGTLELELKICVDVLSDVIQMIGKLVPSVEKFMNDKFNVYGGCLRLAYARYDIQHQRFETTFSYKRYWDGTLFSLRIEANCKSKTMFIYLQFASSCLIYWTLFLLQLGCVLRGVDVLIVILKPGSRKN